MEKIPLPTPVTSLDTPAGFNALPRTEKLARLIGDAKLLRSVKPRVSYYKVGGYYVRVVINTRPLSVTRVEAFSGGDPYQRMLRELIA